MRITSRKKTIAFAITLGVLVAAVALILNVSWIVLNWREVIPLILGVIFFGFIIAGVILNTIFPGARSPPERTAGQLSQRRHP